jgi:putative addiction module killer protein
MFEVVETLVFAEWIGRLKDHRARARINIRIQRLRGGNFGDHSSVGDGVSEMRIDYGPGYRVYMAIRGRTVVVLLCGGDKSTQRKDIDKAIELAKEL